MQKTIEEDAFPPDLKQQYQAQSSQVKRPFWHSLGCLGIVAIFALNLVIGLFATIWGSTQETQLRDGAFRSDLKKLTASPTFESDSLSYKIKSTFDKLETSLIDPHTFEYYSTVKDNKVLFLIKVPDLKKVQPEKRVAITNIIDKFLDRQAGLQGKERYIGVHGKYNMMMVKTPKTEENSNLVASAPLLDFYGVKTE